MRRQLAADNLQPKTFSFTKENETWAKQKIGEYPTGREASAVIPLLMRAQVQEGWVSKAAIEYVAKMLAMPFIRVLEVATFYTQFQLAPVGKKAHVQVCGTTPCMLRGSEKLLDICKKQIAPTPFTVRNEMSWEEVECQGACVNAPMIMIGENTYEDLTETSFMQIIEAFGKGKGDGIKIGTQVERIFSAPAGGLTSLTGENNAGR